MSSCLKDSDDDILAYCIDSEVESWVFDSKTSFHSTFQKDQLKNYHTTEIKRVYLEDESPLEVNGKGDFHIKTKLGLWVVKDVRYIPGLSRQLIFVSQLDNE